MGRANGGDARGCGCKFVVPVTRTEGRWIPSPQTENSGLEISLTHEPQPDGTRFSGVKALQVSKKGGYRQF